MVNREVRQFMVLSIQNAASQIGPCELRDRLSAIERELSTLDARKFAKHIDKGLEEKARVIRKKILESDPVF